MKIPFLQLNEAAAQRYNTSNLVSMVKHLLPNVTVSVDGSKEIYVDGEKNFAKIRIVKSEHGGEMVPVIELDGDKHRRYEFSSINSLNDILKKAQFQ